MRDYSYADLHDLATDHDHKSLMLEMLVAFDEFCSKNGLTYYLSGGTLLGAVRHHGFIPWDDDVDVNMPRPDCEKLMSLSAGRIGRFELMAPNSSANYFAYHWKLFGDDILVAKRVPGGIGTKVYPVFMDIFPIDGLPSNEADNYLHYKEIGLRKKRANFARNRGVYRGRHPWKILKAKLKTRIYSQIGVAALHRRVIEWAMSKPFEDSDYVGVMMTNVHTTEERVRKSEYCPVVSLDFEGHKFNAPAGYDVYLRQLYGQNYMSWLPAHQRISRHNLVPFIRAKGRIVPDITSPGTLVPDGLTLDSEKADLDFDE